MVKAHISCIAYLAMAALPLYGLLLAWSKTYSEFSIGVRNRLPLLALLTAVVVLGVFMIAYYAREIQIYVRKSADRAKGRCIFCGYDLRTTPNRCPECGTPTNVDNS